MICLANWVKQLLLKKGVANSHHSAFTVQKILQSCYTPVTIKSSNTHKQISTQKCCAIWMTRWAYFHLPLNKLTHPCRTEMAATLYSCRCIAAVVRNVPALVLVCHYRSCNTCSGVCYQVNQPQFVSSACPGTSHFVAFYYAPRVKRPPYQYTILGAKATILVQRPPYMY